MDSFPIYLKPRGEFKKYVIKKNLSLLRKDIYDFIIMGKYLKDFYDLEAFFTKHEIKSKDQDITILIDELKNNKWLIARIFGGSALVIFESKEAIENSIWKQQLDFQLI